MRKLVLILASIVSVLSTSCDGDRVYEKYTDFDQYWKASEKPAFEFVIDDPSNKFNIYGNVRNSVGYDWSRFFMKYALQDSSGNILKEDLMNQFLFDEKSGEPLGESGLGDVYDHQFLLLKDFQFPSPGTYKMQLEQFMRTDSLEGILAVGVRVEKVVAKK